VFLAERNSTIHCARSSARKVEVRLTLDDDQLVAEDEQATMVDATAQPPSESGGVPAGDRYALQGKSPAAAWVSFTKCATANSIARSL